jgi:hypothetical protein
MDLYHHHHHHHWQNMGHSVPQKILSDFSIDHPVFTSLDYATTIFFTEQGRQPCA